MSSSQTQSDDTTIYSGFSNEYERSEKVKLATTVEKDHQSVVSWG